MLGKPFFAIAIAGAFIVLPAPTVAAPVAPQVAPALHSAVARTVRHPFGQLLGVLPVRGASPRVLHRLGGIQPPPPPSGAACPPGASQAPFLLCYFQGPVLHARAAYSVFWQPSPLPSGVSPFSADYAAVVNGFFQNVAADSGTFGNVYSTNLQYPDGAGPTQYNSTFGGTVVDTNPYPSGLLNCGTPLPPTSTCITDTQITTELDKVINAQGWPRGLGPVFFVYLPQGVSSCAGTDCSYQVFCAYHTAYQSGAGPPTLYAVEPYAAVPGCDSPSHPNNSQADPVLDTTSHEDNEVITDPLGNAWLDLQGNENGDKCARNYGPVAGSTATGAFNQTIGSGRYFIQSEFSNIGATCSLALPDKPPTADFTPPAAIAGVPASFSAAASDIDGSISTVSWNFGDGTPAESGANVSHVFAQPGTVLVTLTAVDNFGLRTSTSHALQVAAARSTASALDRNKVLVSFKLRRGQTRRSALRHGLKVEVSCSRACAARARAKLRVRRVSRPARLLSLGAGRHSLAQAGTLVVKIPISKRARRRLARQRHPKLLLSLSVQDAGSAEVDNGSLRVGLSR